MITHLQWSRKALEDFKKQIAYIAARNPAAAAQVAQKVDDCALKLAKHSTGRPGRVAGTLEKSVPGLPLVIAYSISTNEADSLITILRLVHFSRDWRKGRWPKDRD